MPSPYTRMYVDWDADGNFTGTYDDITDNIRSMSLSHSRSNTTDYMNGAVLNVQLNNNDNLYSPPKESGALFGKLEAGKNCVLRMWYPYDNFTDTTDTNLTSHEVAYDSSFSWSVPVGAFKCHADGYALLTSGASSFALMDTAEYDTEISSEITTAPSSSTVNYDVGLLLRYIDTDNYVEVTVNVSAGNITVAKTISGSATVLGTTSFAWGSDTKRTLMARIHGQKISGYVDEVKSGAYTLGSTGTGAIDTATNHGFRALSSATAAKFHHFGGFRPLFKGKVKELSPRPAKGNQNCYLRCFDPFEDMKLMQSHTYLLGSASKRANYPFRQTLIMGGKATVTTAESSEAIEDTETDYYSVTSSTGGQVSEKIMDGDNLLDLLYLVQDTEDGFIYVDGHGMFHFEAHDHRQKDSHLHTLQIYQDSYDGTNAGYHQYAYDDGVDGVYNIIEYGSQKAESVVSKSNSLTSNNDLMWSSTEAIAIESGESIYFIGKYRDNSNFGGNQVPSTPAPSGGGGAVASPSASDMIQIWTNADGTGSQLVPYRYFTNEGPDPVDNVYSGNWGRIGVKNNDASTDGYVTKVGIGQISVLSNVNLGLKRVDDSTSMTTHGHRRMTRENTLYDLSGYAKTVADHRLERIKDPIIRMRLDLINHDKGTLLAMVHRRLSDRVHVIETGMEMSYSAYIDGYSIKFSQGNTVVEQTLHLSMVDVDTSAGSWGFGRWGMFKWS